MTTMVLVGLDAALNEGVDVHVSAIAWDTNPQIKTKTERRTVILFIAFLLSSDLSYLGAILIR
jgi:hypothetical protein